MPRNPEDEMSNAVTLALKYLNHPDVVAMPFALSPAVAAERLEKALHQYVDSVRKETLRLNENLTAHHEGEPAPDCVWCPFPVCSYCGGSAQHNMNYPHPTA